MDYQGQRLAELLFYWIIISFGAVGWVIGYFQQDFMIVFQAWLVGVVISVLVSLLLVFHSVPFSCCSTNRRAWISPLQLCVPDWPIFNRHPVKWLESIPDRRQIKQ